MRGVRTDRPGGDIEAPITIACDGVNSFLAKEAGLYHHAEPEHFTLGVKEVLALPRAEIDARFALTGDEGADFEILGGTGDVPGGAFLYTNAESISVGVVLQLPALGASGRRPEEFIDAVKTHPAIAPLVAGGELKEHSAHLIPEGGYDAMPDLATDGLLDRRRCGRAVSRGGHLARRRQLRHRLGRSGGRDRDRRTAIGRHRAPPRSAAYRRRLEANFVLRDHKKLRHAPTARAVRPRAARVSEHRLRHGRVACSPSTTRSPRSAACARLGEELRKSNVRLRDAAKDAWTVLRTYG